MKVTILHQTDPHFVEYKPGDRLTRVFAFIGSDDLSPEEACDWAFHAFNAPEEFLTDSALVACRDYRAHQLRSLSVGDVVAVEQEGHLSLFACASFGWTELNDEPNIAAA